MADPLPTINLGAAVVVTDPVDNELSSLNGPGIVIHEGDGARARDGSMGDPIVLPSLARLDPASFPLLVIQNEAGQLLAMRANPGAAKKNVITRLGSFSYEEPSGIPCYNEADICECAPEMLAGWREIDGRWCLVRYTAEPSADLWADTNSVDIQGGGVVGSEYAAHVKISADPGNALELRADGLYVATS